MQDINKCIKETDTDNVTLKKLKELGTKLTGQENVEGETIADVIDVINKNYTGGSGGSSEPTILYDQSGYLSYSEEINAENVSKNDIVDLFKKGFLIKDGNNYYKPINCTYFYDADMPAEYYTVKYMLEDGTTEIAVTYR